MKIYSPLKEKCHLPHYEVVVLKLGIDHSSSQWSKIHFTYITPSPFLVCLHRKFLDAYTYPRPLQIFSNWFVDASIFAKQTDAYYRLHWHQCQLGIGGLTLAVYTTYTTLTTRLCLRCSGRSETDSYHASLHWKMMMMMMMINNL